MLMYGLRRSPILAHFQKIPITLDLRAARAPPSQRGGFLSGLLLAHAAHVGDTVLPILVPVHDAGGEVVDVCARAYQEEDDLEQGLEVEEGRLRRRAGKRRVSWGNVTNGKLWWGSVVYTMLKLA